MSPVDADVALAVTVTASFRKYCFTFSAPSTAFALLNHDMFTYIVPLVGSLVVVSVGAVDVLSTLEITVLELLIVVETSELALSTLETAEDTTELSALVSLVEVDTDTASEFSLVSLALQPESKIAEIKKIVKIRAFFIIFCPFQ